MEPEQIKQAFAVKNEKKSDQLQSDLMSLYLDSLLHLSPEPTVCEPSIDSLEIDTLSDIILRDVTPEIECNVTLDTIPVMVKSEPKSYQGIIVKVGKYEVILDLTSIDQVYALQYSPGSLCNLGTYHIDEYVLNLLDFSIWLKEKRTVAARNLSKTGHIVGFGNRTLGFHCELISGPECFSEKFLKLYPASSRINSWFIGYSLQNMRPIINLVEVEKAIFTEKC